MRSKILLAALLGLAWTLPVWASDSIAFGNRVLVLGDAVGQVYQLAGTPDRIKRIENKRGAEVGERFEYYRDGKTILITIRDGRVAAIEEVRGSTAIPPPAVDAAS
ncbi:DUF2845 domain-containing protein [Lysobacter silvisoli]|uniref:DUF2845 domain-containing protein n=1 Tax=Lysobacter silvisoli TaxID=2293254 RepID=A0A371K1U0_9GAMM|nr:DUF2845 domain-containing protein [Lysobacter silvisoli]RDZ27901.1 DUF2845 domain-containing protein [Lysobacter silvisoli]